MHSHAVVTALDAALGDLGDKWTATQAAGDTAGKAGADRVRLTGNQAAGQGLLIHTSEAKSTFPRSLTQIY